MRNRSLATTDACSTSMLTKLCVGVGGGGGAGGDEILMGD